jgi:hypothetical protein
MEIWSSMKIMKKDHRGHKLMVLFSQLLVTIHIFALFLHCQTTLSTVRKIKSSTLSEVCTISKVREMKYSLLSKVRITKFWYILRIVLEKKVCKLTIRIAESTESGVSLLALILAC